MHFNIIHTDKKNYIEKPVWKEGSFQTYGKYLRLKYNILSIHLI